MNANSFEAIPLYWDEDRDGRFFRIVAPLFSRDFCFRAGVLLSTYDVEEPVDDPALVNPA